MMKQLLDVYRQRLSAVECRTPNDEHCLWMLDQIAEMKDTGKANRWLGFVQGHCWAHGLFSIDEMRGHVRTLLKNER